MATPNDLRKGSVIRYQNWPYSVMEVVHRANGRGRGFVQAKMRNLQNGSSTDVKFDSSDIITLMMKDSTLWIRKHLRMSFSQNML